MGETKVVARKRVTAGPPSPARRQTVQGARGSANALRERTPNRPSPSMLALPARGNEVMHGTQMGSATMQARVMRTMQSSVGNARINRMLGDPLQAKLTVGTAGDMYEQEADRVAGRVMQTPLASTVGQDIHLGAGQYQPGNSEGKKPLAHGLTHVMQQSADEFRVARAPENEIDAGVPDAQPVPTPTTPAPESTGTPAQEMTAPPAPAQAPTVTPGGHMAAPPGVAVCPDAPSRIIVVVGCITAPSATPPAKETAVLPAPSPGRFGGDNMLARFAKELAQCRAERTVKDEIERRYRADVVTAKKKATEESKADTEAAVKAAIEGLDPNDKRAIAKAKTKATAEAKKAAAKKVAAAEHAVSRQDVAKVTTELATEFENALAVDYDNTIKGGLARYGASWRNTMQARLDRARKRISKEKSAKPKVAKGETPPPPKTAEEIAAAVEAEMVPIRCEQTEWALNNLESLKHGWAVGRREEVDFDTLGRSAKYLKDFKPTYEVPEAERVEIPTALQASQKMPGVAPELASFLTQLAADPDTPAFTVGNYKGHGGGAWSGKGFSADLFLKAGLDQRGFWPVPLAVKFLLALDATARALGARWRVLYNDFRVADEVNKTTGSRNVGFMGDSNNPKLNWHGPLVLHMHLDLEIPKAKPAPTTPGTTPTP